MDEIIQKIEKLKSMQSNPKYYLSLHFHKLRTQVDFKYLNILIANKDYGEIINKIESFEQDALSNLDDKLIETYKSEIESIEKKLNDCSNLADINILIDELIYQIEKTLFSNKSFFFIDNAQSQFSFAPNSFLLIINKEYKRNGCFDNGFDENLVTRNGLNCFIVLRQNLKNVNFNSRNVLHIDFFNNINLEEINFCGQKIQDFDPFIFKGLVNLKNIDFSHNKIRNLHQNLFNGLVNLRSIDFSHNEIRNLHQNLFNGLVNLETVYSNNNMIRELDLKLFNGLINLKYADFKNNQIKEKNLNLSNELASLKILV